MLLIYLYRQLKIKKWLRPFYIIQISFDPLIKIILAFILFWQTILIGSMKIKVSFDSSEDLNNIFLGKDSALSVGVSILLQFLAFVLVLE